MVILQAVGTSVLIWTATVISYLAGITVLQLSCSVTGSAEPVSFGTAMAALAGGLVELHCRRGSWQDWLVSTKVNSRNQNLKLRIHDSSHANPLLEIRQTVRKYVPFCEPSYFF